MAPFVGSHGNALARGEVEVDGSGSPFPGDQDQAVPERAPDDLQHLPSEPQQRLRDLRPGGELPQRRVPLPQGQY